MLPGRLKVEMTALGRDEPGNPLGIWGRAATALILPDGGSPFPGVHRPPRSWESAQVCFHAGCLLLSCSSESPALAANAVGLVLFRE